MAKPKPGEESRPAKRFTLEESTIAALEAQAKKEDRAQSRIVNQAIREYIERQKA